MPNCYRRHIRSPLEFYQHLKTIAQQEIEEEGLITSQCLAHLITSSLHHVAVPCSSILWHTTLEIQSAS